MLITQRLPARLGLFLLLAAIPATGHSGTGRIIDNGSMGIIDLSINFPWQPTEDEFQLIKSEIEAGSETLWDATEGQMRIGTVFIHERLANERIADIRIVPQGGHLATGIAAIGDPLRYIQLDLRDILLAQLPSGALGSVSAHELGHYALGLYDEYVDNKTNNGCKHGPCFAVGTLYGGTQVDPRNNCIMQPSGWPLGSPPSELCVHSNHDKVKGCGQTTQQTYQWTMSCFEALARQFSFILPPSDLPEAAPPPGFAPPSFVDQRSFSEAVFIVMDSSNSMNWNTEKRGGEICGNGIDDDNDGLVDEWDDCTEPRLEYARGAAKLFLDLLYDAAVKVPSVGIVSFNDQAVLDSSLVALDDESINELKAIIDGIAATGNTATSEGLDLAHNELLAKPNAVRSVLLISDGHWNQVIDPQLVAKSMAQDRIAVHTIGTGAATASGSLNEIAQETYGYPNHESNADALLPAVANVWANTNGHAAVIPKVRFHTNARTNAPDIPLQHAIASDAWFTGDTGLDALPQGAEENVIEFIIPDDSHRATIIIAGTLGDMTHFRVDADVRDDNGFLCESANPGSSCRVVESDYHTLIWLDKPKGGAWTLTLRSREDSPGGGGGSGGEGPTDPGLRGGAEQRGYVTILTTGSAYLQELRVDTVEDVVSISDPVIVNIEPIYHTPLRQLEAIYLSVEDPAGGAQSFSVYETDDGGYQAMISGLIYRGVHKISVYARTGLDSYNDPGEIIGNSPHGAGGAVVVPLLEYGAQLSFATVDGELPFEYDDES